MMSDDDDELLAVGERMHERLAAAGCARAKRRFDRGDRGALLDAVFECATAGVALPEWAARAFRDAYLETRVKYRHASWDAVFGRPHKKHVKLPAKAHDRKLRWRVWVAVTDIRMKSPRRDAFPDVARTFRISVSLARDYFYAADRFAKSSDERFRRHAERNAAEARLAGVYELSK